MIGNTNDKTSFPHWSLLARRQVPNLCRDFEYSLSANINIYDPADFLANFWNH